VGLTAGLAVFAIPSIVSPLASPAGSGPNSARTAQAARAALTAVRLGAPNMPAPFKGASTNGARTSNAPNAASNNWSGYADTTGTANYFTSVSGSWVVPKVSCTHEDEIVSTWVGIDGATDGTVEQTGTTGQCFEGTPIYYSWYEMFPAGTVEVGTTVLPGDHISASVTRPSGSSTTYNVTLTDSTTAGNNISTNATCALATCLDESVEWIAERPSYSIGVVPLAVFPSWTLSSGKAAGGGTSGSIKTFGATEDIETVDATDSYALAIPGSLNAAGNLFKDTFQKSPGESY
jgi:Peptidase A4 family